MDISKSIESHTMNTCELIIQHIKNIIAFQKEVNQPWGYHSRFAEWLLHPEDVFLLKGSSKTIYENPNLAKKREHIVPLTYLMSELWSLIEQNELSSKNLAYILKRNLGIAYLSEDETKKLDTKSSGLKMKMPKGWNLVTDDPLDRLNAIGIVLVNEQGLELKTLKDA